MRRLVAPLLATGAVLLGAALVWPTQRIEAVADGVATPLLDAWLWGRVRSLSQVSSTDLDGSLGTLSVLALAAVLALVAATVWLSALGGPRTARRRGTAAAVTVVGALAAAGLGLRVMSAGLGFGWYSPGVPTFSRSVVASFPPVAIGAWCVALFLMGALPLRGRGPDEAPHDPSAD